MNREIYRQKWSRFQQRQEKIYTRKFKKALQEQVSQYLSQGAITAEPLQNVLIDLYKTVGPLWSAKTGIRKGGIVEMKAGGMGFSERILELLRDYFFIDLFNDAQLMTQYSREVIARVLTQASITGASTSDIVKELTAHPDFSAMRARRIARTETVTASNVAAVINAKESGLKMNKEWISVQDKRTRHSHRSIDGRIVGINDYFTMDTGVTMQQPGARQQQDGQAVPGSEVVNCRCVCGFIPVRGRNGLPVRV